MNESPLRTFKAPDKPLDTTNGNTSNTQNKMFSKVNSLARQLTGSSLDDSGPEDSSQPSEPPGLEGEIPKSDSSQSLDIPNSKFLWRVSPRPHYAEEYYNFTSLSMTLNQEFPGMRESLPATDSRFRPDVRILEEGDVGECDVLCFCMTWSRVMPNRPLLSTRRQSVIRKVSTGGETARKSQSHEKEGHILAPTVSIDCLFRHN